MNIDMDTDTNTSIIINIMPNEWLKYIFSYLSTEDKIIIQRTSKRIRNLISEVLKYDAKYFCLNIIFHDIDKIKKSKIRSDINPLPGILGYYKVVELLNCDCPYHMLYRYPLREIEHITLSEKIFSYFRVNKSIPQEDINRYIKNDHGGYTIYYPYHFIDISKENIRRICTCSHLSYLRDYFYFIGYTDISDMMQISVSISPFLLASIPKMSNDRLILLINIDYSYAKNILWLLYISYPNRYKEIVKSIPKIREHFIESIHKGNELICHSHYYCCDIEKLWKMDYININCKNILILRWLEKREDGLLPILYKFNIFKNVIFEYIIIYFHREEERTKYLNILADSMGDDKYTFYLYDRDMFTPSVAMFTYRTRNKIKWVPRLGYNDDAHPVTTCLDIFFSSS